MSSRLRHPWHHYGAIVPTCFPTLPLCRVKLVSLRSSLPCPRFGLRWPESPYRGSPASSGHWHPWRRCAGNAHHRGKSTLSSTPLDHKGTTLIRTYPFRVMTGPPWTVDAVRNAHVSESTAQVVHQAYLRVLHGAQSAATWVNPQSAERFCSLAPRFSRNQPTVQP